MERLSTHRNILLISIIFSSLIVTYLHYSTLPQIHELHNVFAELYYIPILLGALLFGLKGAIFTYAGVSILYTPYIFLNWTGEFSFIANKLSHALFSGAIACIAGYMTDREKKLRIQAEKDHYLSSLGRASAAIVHDLKSPLITVAGFARRMYEEKGDVKEGSQIIINAAQTMQSIVNDVLDFAKPITLNLSHEDLKKIINYTCESCKAKADDKEIIISLNLPQDQVIVCIDKQKFERALGNLINNAIDASLIGGTISVTLERGNTSLSMIIKDYGAGMDKDTIENIFIPFYTKKSSGTGLGMAIAKKIIEEHKGEIHITSKEQIGTVITVKLPL